MDYDDIKHYLIRGFWYRIMVLLYKFSGEWRCYKCDACGYFDRVEVDGRNKSYCRKKLIYLKMYDSEACPEIVYKEEV